MGITRIGVTGHRELPHYEKTAESVSEVIRRIKGTGALSLKGLVVISPLAEGADRLVAKEVLKHYNSSLEAVLPFDAAQYVNDFEDAESRMEFESLLGLAYKVHHIDALGTRRDAYLAAGRFVVDNCDVLVTLWDGRPADGKGGTADVVEYARRVGRRLYRIDTEHPESIITL